MGTPRRRPLRWIISLAAALLVIAPASAAWAGQAGDYTGNGVHIRAGAGTSYASLGVGYPGQRLCIWATVRGQSVGGENRWARHSNTATGVLGYSSYTQIGYYPGTLCA